MAILDTTPLINGTRYDFASIELAFGAFRTVAFKSIHYKGDLQAGEARGNQPRILGASFGIEKNEAGFEMFKEEYSALVLALGPGYKTKFFTITALYGMLDGPKHIDILRGFRIGSDEDHHSAGPDPLVVKVEASVVRQILRDGIDPLGLPQIVGV
jgi:hypothetical protein